MAAPLQVERLDEAERLLVSGAFVEAAQEAAGLLAQQLTRGGGDGPGEASQEEEDVRLAAAAVLLQARRLAGDNPVALRTALEAGFGSLRAVPPESLELWARLALKDGQVDVARATLQAALAYEPSERLAHPAEALTQLARVLALDVLTTGSKDPGAALKWLAVDGVAVMTHDTRRELMREVNARKLELEQLRADASAQWANAKAEAQKHSRGGGQQQQQQLAQPPPRSSLARPRAAPGAQTPPAGGNALSRLVSRSRAAAQADPEGAACVALLAGCAVYALTADRRGLKQALGTVGAALSSLATMAIGGTTAAAV